MNQLVEGYPNIWIGLPKKGPEPHTGMCRPTIYDLIKRGAIKSACVRKPGNITGKRLVWLPSLLEYIERNVQTPDEYAVQCEKRKEARGHE